MSIATAAPAATSAQGIDALEQPATQAEPISKLLKQATREAHESAETTSFVTDLMGGKLNRAAYVALAAQHRPIYTELVDLGARIAHLPGAADLVRTEMASSYALVVYLASLQPDTHTPPY